MSQITNATRQTLSFPKKDGTMLDIRAGETISGAGLDTEAPKFKGAVLSSAIVVSATKAEAAREAPRSAAVKSD